MSWLAAAALLLLALLCLGAWLGSHVVFHPPKMLRHTVWPEQYGLRYEKILLRTADRVGLAAWVIPAEKPTRRSLLLLHGWGDNKGDLLQHTHFLSRRFNLMYVDHRHHGESEGSRTTIGCRETLDVEAALAWLKAERPDWLERLGVFGLSMGGGLAIWAAARHPFLRCVAVEAPFPSFNRVVGRYTRNSFRLPYYPLAWATLQVIRWRLGEDPEPYSPIHHVDKVAGRPLLFIAGGLDTLMPPEDVREVFDRAGEPKELWVVEQARHGKCEEAGGDAYRAKLLEFFERNLPS